MMIGNKSPGDKMLEVVYGGADKRPVSDLSLTSASKAQGPGSPGIGGGGSFMDGGREACAALK